MANGKLMVGTTGFSYQDWLGNFYPQFCPQADLLKYYSHCFSTVEIDSTFYKIPSEKTVTKWNKVTPDNFIFSAKFPRTVTHEGTIEQRIEQAKYFVEVMQKLNDKLGVLLLQFPYSFKPDQFDTLLALISTVVGKNRIAVELRNRKWLDNTKIFKIFSENNIALCQIDHPWMPRIDQFTADFSYFRFLGDRKKIEDDFTYIRDDRIKELTQWKEIIKESLDTGRDTITYFNNHYSGHAPTTAMKFVEIISGSKK